MKNNFRVVAWNCRRANAESPLWDYLRKLDPDVALLQEVGSFPDSIRSCFACHAGYAMGKNGSPSRVQTVLLVKGRIGKAWVLTTPTNRVPTQLMKHFEGNLLARQLLPENGPPLKAVSVYSPAWPVDRSKLHGVDISEIGQNGTVWVSDLLYESLNHLKPDCDEAWIVAGDFNLSETFDQWTKKPRGNREYLESMANLGLVECLRRAKGKLTPTFRTPRNGHIEHQMDHLFTTASLARNLTICDTGRHDDIFDVGLSDHLPIIADFCLPQTRTTKRATKTHA